MDYIIEPDDMEVHPFQKLGTLPLESDFILIRKKTIKDLKELYPDFAFMIPYLGKFTVIEYKSPLDTLRFEDFDKARAYMILAKLKFGIRYDGDIHIIHIASHFQKGYKEHVEKNGYEYEELEEGIYGNTKHKHHIYWMDLSIIGDKEPENIMNLFSSNYKKYENSYKLGLIRQYDVVDYICQYIFKKKELRMNNIEIRHLPEFTKSREVMRQKFLESFTLEQRLAGLGPEQRLAGLGPEQRLAGLGPEQRLAGLRPEQRLAGLGPEQRLAGLRPEQRLAGLGTEQRLAGLRPEQRLAGLGTEQRLAGLRPEQRLAGLTSEEMEQLRNFLNN